MALAWGGISLAIFNLLIFYVEIARGIAPSGSGATDYMALLRHLPFTLPFILLAELLALIMFRYQSKGLEMMRYFSNEVTTLTLRQAGALATIEYGSNKAVADLAAELLKAERNIILRKDEKTVELAQNRDDDATLKALLAEIKGMTKQEKAAAG